MWEVVICDNQHQDMLDFSQLFAGQYHYILHPSGLHSVSAACVTKEHISRAAASASVQCECWDYYY